jgi:hypothetical protein
LSFIGWWIIEMKSQTKKILGVLFVVSFIGITTSVIACAGPKDGYPDEPINFEGGGAGPTDGYPDEPIVGFAAGPTDGYPDEPISNTRIYV